MDEKSQAREVLKSLAEEVAEAALYLRELGVEGLEGLTPAAAEPRTTAREERVAPKSPRTLDRAQATRERRTARDAREAFAPDAPAVEQGERTASDSLSNSDA